MERRLRKKRERARPVSCPAGGERVRVRGGVRTQNVIIHDVLSPPLRDAPPHGITPLRYSVRNYIDLKVKVVRLFLIRNEILKMKS